MAERHHLEDLGIDGSMILKRISSNGMGGIDWICLAQDKVRSWALVNAVLNLRVP